LIDKMTSPGSNARWKPRAAFAVFSEDGSFRAGDLEGSEEHGTWLADGPRLLTEDPSFGTVSTWRYVASNDSLCRELTDAETGYRGRADLVFARAGDEDFRENAKKHLRQLSGLGAAAADKLLGEGVFFVKEIRAWSPEVIADLSARTGLSAESLAKWRKAAGGH
jgi:hypothetical protein